MQQLGGAAFGEDGRTRTLLAHRDPSYLPAKIGGPRPGRIRRLAHLLRGARRGRDNTKDAPALAAGTGILLAGYKPSSKSRKADIALDANFAETAF